jgi:two-component system LytT family response regulator
VAAIDKLKPDVVFLDVEMRNLNGLEVVAHIGVDKMPLVIFVTAFDRYALNAFDVNAVDYLLKPFDDARFRKAVARARERLAGGFTPALRQALRDSLRAAVQEAINESGQKPLQRIAADHEGKLKFIDTVDVQCVEARGNYIVIHAAKESHLLRSTLTQAEQMLDPALFLRIHRSIIVNRTHIREIERSLSGEYTLTLANGHKFTSSASYRQDILDYIKLSRPG